MPNCSTTSDWCAPPHRCCHAAQPAAAMRRPNAAGVWNCLIFAPAVPQPSFEMPQTAPDMLSELARARPPRPDAGWSYVVHPIGGAARAHLRRQQRATAQQQWLPDDAPRIGAEAASGAVGGVPDFNPAHASPLEPYVATPSYGVRALNEEESTLADTRVPKPRRRWYASFRGRLR
jgi:hypothetical protein